MSKPWTFAILSILFAACGGPSTRPLVLDRQPFKLPDPPETAWISPNLYLDQHECTNLEYIEYLNWLEEAHGETSEAYQAAVPVFFKEETRPYAADYQAYLRDERFDAYPVVGITLEQARAFAAWKTDRVNELILTERGLLAGQKPLSFSRYFSLGGPHARYGDRDPMPMVRYRLPTEAEWRLAIHRMAEQGRGVERTEAPSGRPAAEHSEELSAGSILTLPARPENAGADVLWHLQTNVAEWLFDGNVTAASASLLPDNATIDPRTQVANRWTGFRLVAEYELRSYNWLEEVGLRSK